MSVKVTVVLGEPSVSEQEGDDDGNGVIRTKVPRVPVRVVGSVDDSDDRVFVRLICEFLTGRT